MIIAMNRQGVPTVGEASLSRHKSGKGFASHSAAPCTFSDMRVIVSLSRHSRLWLAHGGLQVENEIQMELTA